jgi:hypothetical protein
MTLLLPPAAGPRPGMRRALGFVRGWVRAPGGVSLRVTTRELPGLDGPIRVLEGVGAGGGAGGQGRGGAGADMPGWVLLHGVTILGLEHPSLVRFVRALAASGARVMVPEITPWTRLDLDLEEAQRRLRASIGWMAASPGVAPGGVGVAGFSFGGPQVLHAASEPDVARNVRQVLAWGSYARLHRALRFALTGAFDHPDGTGTGWLDPDPYGRWVTAVNLLPLAEEYGEEGRLVADALRTLAMRWGAMEFDAMAPSGDPHKWAVRERLPVGARDLFDLLAPAAGAHPDPEGAEALGEALTRAAAEHSPLMDPLPGILARGGIAAPVHLLHGRDDVLIPWSETRHLRELLTGVTPDLHEAITGLFAHTDHGPKAEVVGEAGVTSGAVSAGGAGAARSGVGRLGLGSVLAAGGRIRTRTERNMEQLRESARFFAALRRVLG